LATGTPKASSSSVSATRLSGRDLPFYDPMISEQTVTVMNQFCRPHSSECAVNEHRAIIDALVKGATPRVPLRRWTSISKRLRAAH
jgi:hypothetical protein